MYRKCPCNVLLVVGTATLLTGAAQAQHEPRTAPAPTANQKPAGGDHNVIIRTVDDEAIRGTLLALSLPDGLVVREVDAEKRHIPTRDLVRISTAPQHPTRPRDDPTLTLAGGDVLRGRVAEGDSEAVAIEAVDLGRVRVPLDSIERFCTPHAFEPPYRESARWFDRSDRIDADRILLTNGDVADGFVTAIDPEGISLEGTFGETKLPHRLVVAARLASTGPAPNRPQSLQPHRDVDSARPPQTHGPYFHVALRTSGRLTMTGFDWTGGTVDAKLLCCGRVQIDSTRVVRIDVVGGRWEWLSNHRPISYEHTPMLSLDWEYIHDRNVLGEPIRVAGETFEHGVGVHSRSSLTYDLQGAYGEFVTSFGIDDDSGPYADVSVFILVDGARRFDQAHVRPGELFGPIRVDVTKANRIELIVDFGDNGDLQDRFNWVEAALVRENRGQSPIS